MKRTSDFNMEKFASDNLHAIDALELGVAIKKKFGVKLSAESEDSRKHFASVNALAEFILAEKA